MSDGNLRQGPWPPTGPAGGGVDGGGSGAQMTGMEVRLARLEGEVSSFKMLFAAVIAILLGGFGFLGAQLARIDNRIAAVNNELGDRITRVDNRIAAVNSDLGDRITRVDNRIAAVNSDLSDRITRVDNRITAVNSDLDERIAVVDNRIAGVNSDLGDRIAAVDNRITGVDNRIAGLAADVQALPGKISADLANLTRTLADSINAAKQTPPQVLLLPPTAPQAPPSRP